MQIEQSFVLVTGANRGIGKAIAKSFLEAGAAKLYAAVRRPESARPLVDQYGDRVVPIEFDLSKPDTITTAAQTARDVQVVVNNGGILRTADPLDPEAIEKFREELDVNVFGLMRVAQAFAPALKKTKGTLVQLNSVASLRNFAQFTTYSASKAASYSITQGLHDVLGEDGVTVVSVHPGPINTDMADEAGLPEGDPPEVVAEAILQAVKHDTYHVFPDTMAKQIGEAYASFQANVVEPPISES